MAFARARALRTLQSSLANGSRRALPRSSAPARTQLIQRRYASGGESSGGHAESSSDIPWMIGALAVTVPACWYLWPDTSHAEHGDPVSAYEDFAHTEEAKEKADEEKKEEGSEEGESGGDESGGEESKGEESGDESGGDSGGESSQGDQSDKSETPDTSSDEGKGEDKSGGDDSKEAQKAAESSKDTLAGQPSAERSGAPTKASGDEGSAVPPGGDDNQKPSEPEAPEGRSGSSGDKSEETGQESGADTGAQRGKRKLEDTGKSIHADNPSTTTEQRSRADQFGITTGETKHSTQIDQDPNKSKKSDGSPETSKAKGTVKK